MHLRLARQQAPGSGHRRLRWCIGASPSSPERIREVYGVNYARLARIKAQVDPANLFRSNQNILPAPGR